jgi:hypothetical protein
VLCRRTTDSVGSNLLHAGATGDVNAIDRIGARVNRTTKNDEKLILENPASIARAGGACQCVRCARRVSFEFEWPKNRSLEHGGALLVKLSPDPPVPA